MLCFTFLPPQPTTLSTSQSQMGVSIASSSLKFFSFIIITFLLLLLHCSTTVAYAAAAAEEAEQANDTRETAAPPPLPPLPQPPPPPEKPSSAFKPGMAVVVGVLTTMFSLTFLLLLYIKHCNATTVNSTAPASYPTSRAAPFSGRKNSGIDRSIVESLPIFRFGSLMGHKDGLDCAVCLNKFESSEVLRLLPKCKHAFHVECVDTWLDAHSTCPLCRHRVDPEDILLVEDTNLVLPLHHNNEEEQNESCSERNSFVLETRRVSGRHSSVGEKEGGFLEIILEENETERRNGASFRRSLDSATCTSSSSTSRWQKKESLKGVTGWLVRPRKDGMLLVTQQQQQQDAERERGSVGSKISSERRVEHRIIVSPSPKQQQCGLHRDQRWSDVQPSDLLYLTSEMIISGGGGGGRGGIEDRWVINTRSVSEITGLSRFMRNKGGGERGEGVVSRWLAWISRSQNQPAVR